MKQIYVVVDRDDRRRILGLFTTEVVANEFAADVNGVVFPRFIHKSRIFGVEYMK